VAMRMRTTLLLSLVSVSFGLAALSLLAVHTIVEKQIRHEISSDLEHSILTFQNIQTQRRQMLSREAALLADLPVLKSLMTTDDGPTIRDGAKEFYRLSGCDFFALADANGELVALFQQGVPWDGTKPASGLREADFTSTESHYVLRNGQLYELSSQPIYFGSSVSGTRLGYVAVGYAVNDQVVMEVSGAAAAEVIFFADGEIVATTLDAKHRQASIEQKEALLNHPLSSADLRLDHEHYIQASVTLSRAGDPLIQLVVLKSYDKASRYLTQLNHLLIALIIFVLLLSGVLATYISRTITLPLETLVLGARALGAGNFDYPFQNKGALEIQELSTALDRMRTRLQKSQQELLASERLATIGRMASSISHDLRHYLSAVYANAEFLGYDAASPAERVELLAEVRLGVEGMTELIDSLLLFSRTGQALQPTYESLPFLVERALQLVRAHPDAQDVSFTFGTLPLIEVWMDALKIERAIYNLLLNGCQAAKINSRAATVQIALSETEEWIRLYITDNGPGVPDSIRVTLFQPFVSEGKQGGAGLGLTLANKIAEEHGGSVALEESQPGRTVFSLSIAKATLSKLAELVQQPNHATTVSHH
jgi:signal transduction histidine kinase